MKKLMALLLSVMMVGCLGVTALAAEEENQEMVPILAEVPEDWENPFAWAWADDGTNAFAAWPGEAMTEGEDGWYSIEVPGWVNSIIINANEGGVQTTDLSVEVGKDVWISVSDAENAAVSYEQPSGEAPEEAPAPSEASTESAPEDEGEGEGNTIIWIVVAAVVIVAVVAIAVAVSKKKKK